MPMVIKLSGVVSSPKRDFPCIKSHIPLYTLTHEVARQIKHLISLLPQDL